jgi:hypothetical protein
MIVVGGLIALVSLTAQGALLEMLRRWFDSARISLLSRRVVYFRSPADSAARSGLPFAVAMGFGAAAYQMWGAPWV